VVYLGRVNATQTTPILNAAQAKALAFAQAEGTVFAGRNTTKQMSSFTVAASTLRALERMGLVACETEIGTGNLLAKPVARKTVDLTETDILTIIANHFSVSSADVEIAIRAIGGFDFVSATVRNAIAR
jgi:hypothetical protein